MAEHSFWVAIYAMAVAVESGLNDRSTHEVVLRALLHDAEESVTADLPALVKAHVDWDPVKAKARNELFGGAKGVSMFKDAHYGADICNMVKAGDLISALVYADEEVKIGNSSFITIRNELLGSIQTLANKDIAPSLQRGIREVVHGLGFSFKDGIERTTEMSHLG